MRRMARFCNRLLQACFSRNESFCVIQFGRLKKAVKIRGDATILLKVWSWIDPESILSQSWVDPESIQVDLYQKILWPILWSIFNTNVCCPNADCWSELLITCLWLPFVKRFHLPLWMSTQRVHFASALNGLICKRFGRATMIICANIIHRINLSGSLNWMMRVSVCNAYYQWMLLLDVTNVTNECY